MPTLNLTNITIKKLEDRNFKTYRKVVSVYAPQEREIFI